MLGHGFLLKSGLFFKTFKRKASVLQCKNATQQQFYLQDVKISYTLLLNEYNHMIITNEKDHHMLNLNSSYSNIPKDLSFITFAFNKE
jgi:hypothetical protein